MHNEQYPGLNGLSYCIRWLEQCLSILAEPLLIIGFIVSMVDLLTGGKLLSNVIIMYGWSIVQAVAVDACFVVMWRRTAVAARERRYGTMLANAFIGAALGFVAWAAMDIQSLAQALGIGSNNALNQLGLNIEVLTHARSAIAVVMGAVVAVANSGEHAAVQATAVQGERRVFNIFSLFNVFVQWYVQVKGAEVQCIEQGVKDGSSAKRLEPPAEHHEPTGLHGEGSEVQDAEHVEPTGVQGKGAEVQDESNIITLFEQQGSSDVQTFITSELAAGRTPTLKDITDATGCSKNTAIKYRRMHTGSTVPAPV